MFLSNDLPSIWWIDIDATDTPTSTRDNSTPMTPIEGAVADIELCALGEDLVY